MGNISLSRERSTVFQIIRKKQYLASVELEKWYKKEQGNGLLDNCYIEALCARFLGYIFKVGKTFANHPIQSLQCKEQSISIIPVLPRYRLDSRVLYTRVWTSAIPLRL